mmetsp:Transcript_28271/g.48069  ORF Transcript_28271/g.48069 Transcript_28271/m.48069 type:complete len:599 (+) Transcript_28271:442-2238(+)
MKPKLLMICLLRSSAAALATHPKGSSIVGRSGGGGKKSLVGGFNSFFTHGHAAALRDDDDSTTTAATDASSTSTALHQTSRNMYDTSSSSSSSSSDRKHQQPLLTSGHIAFRLTRRTDVAQIQSCNLATLPENYNSNFYANHMRTWPELTLVAEHIPEGCEGGVNEEEDSRGYNGLGRGSKITPLSDYIRGRSRGGGNENNRTTGSNNSNKPRKEIVGYILGKVEERPVNPPPRRMFPPSRVPLYNNDEGTLSQYLNGNSNNNGSRGVRFPSRRSPPSIQKEKIGHVTSLAVHSHARRLGIATSLMHQLHYHLQECYGAHSIGLHVRISNRAAVNLYCEDGYDVADIIPMYYGDGEDAYFMRKDFEVGEIDVEQQEQQEQQQKQQQMQQQEQQQQQQQQRQWRRGEKERAEFLNRDPRSGSFFDNRKSLRDTLTPEERAWVTNGSRSRGSRRSSSPSSLSGQFQRSFRTFFNGGEAPSSPRPRAPSQSQRMSQQRPYQLPPWETGPEGLRLPRYCKVNRAEKEAIDVVPNEVSAVNGSDGDNSGSSRGMSLKELVMANSPNEEEEEDDYLEPYEEEVEEEEDDLLSLENARVAASGSV